MLEPQAIDPVPGEISDASTRLILRTRYLPVNKVAATAAGPGPQASPPASELTVYHAGAAVVSVLPGVTGIRPL